MAHIMAHIIIMRIVRCRGVEKQRRKEIQFSKEYGNKMRVKNQ